MTERECANGRRRYRSRKEAEQLAAEFEGSGLTQEEFCERNDVSRKALARYVKRQRRFGAGTHFSPKRNKTGRFHRFLLRAAYSSLEPLQIN
jgi:transcriptional regulator with XRE-family HTH domain